MSSADHSEDDTGWELEQLSDDDIERVLGNAQVGGDRLEGVGDLHEEREASQFDAAQKQNKVIGVAATPGGGSEQEDNTKIGVEVKSGEGSEDSDQGPSEDGDDGVPRCRRDDRTDVGFRDQKEVKDRDSLEMRSDRSKDSVSGQRNDKGKVVSVSEDISIGGKYDSGNWRINEGINASVRDEALIESEHDNIDDVEDEPELADEVSGEESASKRREEETRKAAVAELNTRLGRDPASLADIEEIVDQLQQAKNTLEQKLQLVLTAAPDQLSEAVQVAEAGLRDAEALQTEAEDLRKEVSAHQESVQQLLGGVQQELKLLQQQDRVRCYQGWVRSVQVISAEMVNLSSSNSGGSDETELLGRYSELDDTLRHIAGHTACGHLQGYVLHTLQYWHARLLQHFSQELECVLKGLKYPFISTNTSARQPKPSPELLARLQALIKHLLRLHQPPQHCQLPPTLAAESSAPGAASGPSDTKAGSEGDAGPGDALSTSVLNSSLSSDGSTRESLTSTGGRFCSASSSPVKGCGASSPAPGDGEAPSQPAIVADFAPLVTPLQLLLKPLEVRFHYHFSGNKKTNSAAHPEWCLTRVLTWINEHVDFLSRHVQPVLDECQYGHLRAQTELSRGLVRLVVLKLSQDLPSVMADEDLFCHSLQETLSFERELRLCCGYPGSQPSVLTVLTRPRVLDHWLRLERKFAVAVMDELVSMSGAWQSDQLGQEGGGVTACAEQLVTLLQGITDRYKPLPQPGHRLQFLEVQLDVLDEFRVRAVQLSRELQQSPVASHYPAILCTLHHLACTLRDWADMPFFLELGIYRSQQRQLQSAVEARLAGDMVGDAVAAAAANRTLSPEPCSVFEESVLLYDHVQQEMLATLLDHVMTLIRARFMPYRRDKWFLEPGKSGSSVRCSDVSGSLCPLLQVLARQLHCLRSALAPSLFSQLWQTIAAEIDKFLYEELVLQNHFSEVGCVQFEYDMTRALFPMFSEFTARPESYFPLVQESLLLLMMPLAPALLLRDTLRQAQQSTRLRGRAAEAVPAVVEPVAALADHAVTRITPENAFAVLQARNNISVI